ncbi:MAG: hypothetical protein PW734_03805 [Verrucomicrobium sp.]|nr:hypothetical protein [Verrucomicrobium sp.]
MKQPAPLPSFPKRTAPVAEAMKDVSPKRPGFFRQILEGLGACVEKGGPVKMG